MEYLFAAFSWMNQLPTQCGQVQPLTILTAEAPTAARLCPETRRHLRFC